MALSAAKEDALRQTSAGNFPRRPSPISHVKRSATLMDVQAPLSRAALNNLSAGIVIIDSGGEIIFSNRLWRTKVRPDIFPFPECEHTSNYLELWSGYGSDNFRHDTHTLINGLTNIFSGNQNGFKHGLTLPSLQEQKWYDCEIIPFEFNDNLHAVITHRDVSRFRQAEREIEWMAYHDPLTGLRNRNLFDVHLEQSLARANRDKTNAALLFFDLDSFKAINDTLGHPSGDLLLKAVAERLALRIRKSDTLVRYGGDEFIVILNNCGDQAGISVVARDLLKTLRAPYMLNGEEMYISASIGIARYPADTRSIAASNYIFVLGDQGENYGAWLTHTRRLGRGRSVGSAGVGRSTFGYYYTAGGRI